MGYQCITRIRRVHMSLRKPLVRFETASRAQLVPDNVSQTSMPGRAGRRRRKRTSRRRVGSSSGGSKRSKPRVVKGRVNVRVAGYTGVQKVAPSKLIKYLPANKLRQAARKVLVASGTRPNSGSSTVTKRRRRRRTKVRRRGKRKGGVRRRRTRKRRRVGGKRRRTRRKRS